MEDVSALAAMLQSQQAAEGLEPQDRPKKALHGHPHFPWDSPTPVPWALETVLGQKLRS